jgi:hypothetical protein
LFLPDHVRHQGQHQAGPAAVALRGKVMGLGFRV